eukprot:2150564-Heterocapsa_arctica.AAC.1
MLDVLNLTQTTIKHTHYGNYRSCNYSNIPNSMTASLPKVHAFVVNYMLSSMILSALSTGPGTEL